MWIIRSAYQLLRHPLSGAVIAHEAGLPDELVHLIAVHSFEGEKSYQTVESNFVRKLDMFVFENSVWGLQKAKSRLQYKTGRENH